MRILSVDGGGYLGLASAAFLSGLEDHFGSRCSERFDLFCGTSTGAIIALALASGMNARDVTALYERFGREVFWNPVPGTRALRTWVRGVVAPRYSNRSLRRALNETFGDQTLGELKARGKFVLVTTFSTSSGRPWIFKTDHAPDYSRDDCYRVADVALASAAAPLYLPAVTIRNPASGVDGDFCDGGVVANHPAMLGYVEAVSALGVPPGDVRLLSVSTPRGDLADRPTTLPRLQRALLGRGLLSWGSRLGGIMIDGTSAITHEALRRLVEVQGGGTARYNRVHLTKTAGLGLDVATRAATVALKQIGAEAATDDSRRRDLAAFFRD